MKNALSVYNTNQKNKYGYRIPTSGLEMFLSQAWRDGTPMFISHDYHRPLGWSRPLGLQISSPQVALLGISSFPEEESEQEIINELALSYLSQLTEDVDAEFKKKLLDKLGDHLSGEEVFIERECVTVIDAGIAEKALPHLFSEEKKDKRGLVSLKGLKQIGPGVYEVDGFAVFAHSYFRRALSQINNLNSVFLQKLYDLRVLDGLDLKIALDPDSLGVVESYRTPIELDYWWGPKFTESLLDIPVGVARHEATEKERAFHQISRTEFWWHKQNDIHSLECEEIRDAPSSGIGSDHYACRYVHSMVEDSTGNPFHLDGAIRIYEEDKFIERLGVDISNAGKDTAYTKLWRVDGELKVSLWKELICHFYRDNHLPGEYLGGSDGQKDEVMDDSHEAFQSELLSPYVSSDDGVEIFVSYQPKETSPFADGVNIVTYDSIVSGEDRVRVIELSALDFIKMVTAAPDVPATLEGDIRFVAYEDMDINFPLVVSKGSESVGNANKTIDIFKRFIDEISKRGDDRVLSFCIVVEYEECNVQFSFISNVNSLNAYFKGNDFRLPDSFNDMGAWASKIHMELNSFFVRSCIHEYSRLMLNNQGVHRISRSFIDPKYVVVKDGRVSINIDSKEREKFKLHKYKKINVSPVSIVKKTLCLECGEDHLICGCLAFGGKSVTMKIIDWDLLSVCWVRESSCL